MSTLTGHNKITKIRENTQLYLLIAWIQLRSQQLLIKAKLLRKKQMEQQSQVLKLIKATKISWSLKHIALKDKEGDKDHKKKMPLKKCLINIIFSSNIFMKSKKLKTHQEQTTHWWITQQT